MVSQRKTFPQLFAPDSFRTFAWLEKTMLADLNILIVEDGGLIGLDLAMAVEDQHGLPVVVSTLSEGLRVIATGAVSAAILDAQLPDGEVTPLASALIDERIPFVVYTGGTLPNALGSLIPSRTVVSKPAPSSDVLAALEREFLVG